MRFPLHSVLFSTLYPLHSSPSPSSSPLVSPAPVDTVVDFAGSDVIFAGESVELFPTVASAVCPVYNRALLADIPSTLVLTRRALAEIFTGGIKYWDDPSILLSNPNIAALLPHKMINVVVRGDKSGTTSIFSRAVHLFLGGENATSFTSQMEPSAWTQQHYRPASLQQAHGTSGVLAAIEVDQYSITYASRGAIRGRASCVHLLSDMKPRGKGGLPSLQAPNDAFVMKAISVAASENSTDLMSSAVLGEPLAWPISSFTYIAVLGNKTSSCERRRWLSEFIRFVYTRNASKSFNDGFVAPPDRVREAQKQRAKQVIECAAP